jgi:hypothetical protein
LDHDHHPLEVHAYAARIIPITVDKDELTLAQAQKLEVEWQLWLEAIRKELTSLIIENEVFEPIKYQNVPEESVAKYSMY